jgi:site-specific recombinase XerD
MTHATNALTPAAILGSLPPHQAAAVGFLARYDGDTRELYRRYLAQWLTWCDAQGLHPFADVTRGHVELYIREISKTNATATVCTAMNPVRGYYKWASIDGLIDRDPAVYARLPKVHHKRKPPVDRTDIRLFLNTARDVSPRHWCLTQMLGVMAMRVSEACSITVPQALHVEQGIRVLHFTGKGNKPASIPIPYQSLAAFDAAIDGRTHGQLLTTLDGQPLSRFAASGLVETVNKRAGLSVHMNPHYLRALAITQGKEGGMTLDEMQRLARHEDPRTTQRHYDLSQENYGSHPVHLVGARLAV